jgi:predicted NBD/HSP70 family sugar kinase
MAETIYTLADREGLSIDEMSGVGVGLPGPIGIVDGETGSTTVNPEAFPGWDNVPITEMLQEHVDRSILLKNNATAAAVGERWYGVGQEVSTFFYLLFGVGLGGGILIDGHPYEGNAGNAGELGYIPTVNHDCLLDDDLSANRPTHLGEHYHLPDLYERLQRAGHDVRRPRDLAIPFEEDVPIIFSWLDQITQKLAPAIVSVEYLIDPKIIVFGGRLPSPLINELISRLEDALPALRTGRRSETPALREASAGVDVAARGVAILPIYDLFAPSPDLMFKNRY